MYPLLGRLYNEPDFRRIVAEFLVLMFAITLLNVVVMEPFLLEQLPSVFPEPSVDIGPFRPPETAVGDAKLVVVVAVFTPVIYVRLFRSARGKRLLQIVRTELDENEDG